jgi:fucose permease
MNIDSKVTKLDVATWASFMIFAVSAVIVAVNLPEISRTFSTNLSEGGGLETARNLVILIVLLLAGALAQRWGKKKFLNLGQYLLAAGLLLASFSQNYTMLILAILIMGFGGGFLEALLTPLVVDIHHRDSGKFLNLSHAFYPIGIVAAALLFGELLTQGYSWRLMFQIAALGALIVAIVFTILRFPPAETDDSSYLKLFASILSRGSFYIFALVIFLGGSIESGLTFWSRTYVETYLSDVPRSGAIALLIFAGSMAIGRFLTAYLAGKMSLNSIMIASAILGVGVTFMIPLASSLFWFYLLLGLAGLATACFWPTIMAEADRLLNVNTTILFVLLSCVGIIGFGAIPWIMGFIGDKNELKAGFAFIPALFAGLIVILIVERQLSKKAAKQPVKEKS